MCVKREAAVPHPPPPPVPARDRKCRGAGRLSGRIGLGEVWSRGTRAEACVWARMERSHFEVREGAREERRAWGRTLAAGDAGSTLWLLVWRWKGKRNGR